MKFQQIRGATVKITYAGKCFLVDPFFADKDSFPPLEDSLHPDKKWPVVGLPLSPEEIIKDVDAAIITHLHPDHFDEAAAKALPKDIKLFAQDDYDAEHISAMGFTDVEVMSEEGTMFGSVALHRTECVHGVPSLSSRSAIKSASALRRAALSLRQKASLCSTSRETRRGSHV